MTRRVVFLDFDGVISSPRAYLAGAECPDEGRKYERLAFDPVAMGLVNMICRLWGAEVVLSTNWRGSWDSYAAAAQFMAQAGLSAPLCPLSAEFNGGNRIDGFKTPYLSVEDAATLRAVAGEPGLDGVRAHRGDEIAAWLHLFGGAGPVEYLILDDDEDMWVSQQGRFVHTSKYDGLLFGDLRRISEVIGIDVCRLLVNTRHTAEAA